MITNLTIRNFALIENTEINFCPNFNVITGETGSGKSIIMQALAIVLGDRASVEQIRTGFDEALITATIDITNNNDVKKYLEDLGINYENDEIIIRRNLLRTGKSRSYINSTPVTSKELLDIQQMLFDFHGQHDGISLLKKETHINYLDNYLKLSQKLNELSSYYDNIINISNELNRLNLDDKERERKLELLKFELDEIEKAKLVENEEIELKHKINILSNMEKIINTGNELNNLFSNENGIIGKIKKAKILFNELANIDNSFSDKLEEINDIYYRLEDIYTDLTNKIENQNFNQDDLDNMISRYELIEKMKKKYGPTYKDIVKYYQDGKKLLNNIENQDNLKVELNKKLKENIEKYKSLAIEISNFRKTNKKKLEEQIINELRSLAMLDINFEIKIDYEENEKSLIEINGKKVDFSKNGIDRVEFLISPNKGEPLKSLNKIASGGELSRIILAFKSILGKTDSINTMIFDEIDSGIGGKVAINVGEKIKEISKFKQIICITHLAQIAAKGDYQFKIYKETNNERTTSKIIKLNHQERINEIARMLSGNITETAIKHAEELLKN